MFGVRVKQMLTAERQKQAFLAPCLPLRFLLEPDTRDVNRSQMTGLRDSAVFFRLWDLFDTLREPEVLAALTADERAVVAKFHTLMESLSWRVIPAYPHIQELPDDDLSPLVGAGRELYTLLLRKADAEPITGANAS
jgi:hypothetical protein